MKAKNHDCCPEIIQKVFLVLDGEMNHKEEKEFLEHLEGCPHCLEMYQIEKSFKEFLCSKVKKKKINSSLLISIKQKVQSLHQR